MSLKNKINLIFPLLIVLMLLLACKSSYIIKQYDSQNFSIDKNTDSISDEAYNSVLEPYNQRLESDLAEVISFADTSLIAYRPESPLSNLISDMLLRFGQEFSSSNKPHISVAFSLANNGGLRTSLPAGEILVRNIFELLPFENELVFLKLTGIQVEILANHIVSRGGEGVAGISFGIKDGKAVNILIQNNPLEVDAVYWMITNDYIANGGDGMKVLKEAQSRIETGEKIRNVIIEELKQMKSMGVYVSAKTDGRIYHVE